MSPALTLIVCMLFISLACHESCADSCAGGSPKDCEKCKEGWEMTEEDGCKGISTYVLAPVTFVVTECFSSNFLVIACSCQVLLCFNI